MNNLRFIFECLYGTYLLKIDLIDELSYEITTDIRGFETRKGSGELMPFQELLDKANIEKWDKEYGPFGIGVEDEIRWSLRYEKDGKIYCTKGQESYEPYGYEYFIEALKLIEPQADFFAAAA